MLLDLHTSLVLKNTGQRRIRGITLLVQAQEVTPGGKASVSVPSLNVAQGQTLPVKPYGATATPTANQLLTPDPQSRPRRSDEVLRDSREREGDTFDLPPPN